MSILTLCVNINVHQNAIITKKSMSAKTGMLRISSSGTLKTVCVQINLEKKSLPNARKRGWGHAYIHNCCKAQLHK